MEAMRFIICREIMGGDHMGATLQDAILILLAGFVFSIIAALVGAFLQRKYDHWRENRPLNRLLNFGASPLLFIFPQRDTITEAILPQTSTEDFLAMNNFITGLLNIDWRRKVGVRDTTRVLREEREENLVIICSPKSNTFARDFQEEWKEQLKGGFFFKMDDKGRWYIKATDGGLYYSDSFDQEKQYKAEGCIPSDLPSNKFDDVAIVTKLTNPWEKRNKVFWIAGIRGIGTWGAAECIKKEWRQIYDELPHDNKEADFSALINIGYDNCDIATIDVCRVVVLNNSI